MLRSLTGVLMGFLFLAGGEPAEPSRSVSVLILKSRSAYALQELTVDLRRARVASLRVCDSPQLFECCQTAWKTSKKHLAEREYRNLHSLVRDSDLFGGRANGLFIDFAYRTLEVRAGNDLAILVTTLNDSFEAGPRKRLLESLTKLGEELASTAVPPRAPK